MPALAFHNDLELAKRIRAQVGGHTAADEIIQGTYWENGKGCFIGCIARADDTTIVEQLTGFPVILQRIAERIFEGLPNDVAKGFPQRVINAPRVGADLSLVAWKFLHRIVVDALDQFGTAEVRAGCASAVAIIAIKANSGDVTADAAFEARADAYAAANTADAVANAAADAAYAAAYADAYAAYAVANAAANATSAAADAAYAAYVMQADLLVALMTECAA